ncbi:MULTISPECIES: response regulator transcription factor [unclassified Pseudoxanthomonas]|uniref:response regulator n=1 Tax=unclassified Pseudoxanthomonas TaxID=2645906 RepID=UPI0008E7CBE0|nr:MULTISPECIES: response regulator transcription factor [unclassified Pseudoxanthomonas]PPJ42825.1 DNA-binding response regulator [Pseudoxanthomonas sp. KAs_5_3]SFV26224.1 two component transcriptional regulator, LuxR family [Pseudoxanthomonas sp. YR558]
MTTATIRILLVDDHAVVREGLKGLLEQEPGMVVVGEAGDGAAAVRIATAERPDLVILDMKMPGAAPADTIAGLRAAAPQAQVLVFTSYAEDAQVRDALTAGASGYLLKDAMREDLLRAVREVHAGRAWLDPQAQRQMLEWMRRPPSVLESLTERERSVLVLIAEGHSNKHIARRLALTEGTVKGYVSQVLDKLGVADRTQAALLAQREGLLPPAR